MAVHTSQAEVDRCQWKELEAKVNDGRVRERLQMVERAKVG